MPTTASSFNEAEALRFALFADDFGEPGDRILSDRIVSARTAHTCNECISPVMPGTRYRKHTGIYGGEIHHYSFCAECCAAMAQVFNGGWDAMDERAKVRAAAIQARFSTPPETTGGRHGSRAQ